MGKGWHATACTPARRRKGGHGEGREVGELRTVRRVQERAGTHEMAMMITGSSAMKSEQIIVRHGLRTISRARGAVIRYERPLGVSSETETMVTLRGQANQSTNFVSDTRIARGTQ